MKENPKFRGVCLDENNNPIPGSEFVAWHSRSMAVTIIVTNEDHSRFLFEIRGPGCPDEVGKLCMPCGYVSWDEWTKESAIREVYEETGVRLEPEMLRLFSINDNPAENRQNITLRYIAEMSDDEFERRVVYGIQNNTDSANRGGEKNECAGLRILTPSEIFQMPDSMFAFSHKNIIRSLFGNEIVPILSAEEIEAHSLQGVTAVISKLLDTVNELRTSDNTEYSMDDLDALVSYLHPAKIIAEAIDDN